MWNFYETGCQGPSMQSTLTKDERGIGLEYTYKNCRAKMHDHEMNSLQEHSETHPVELPSPGLLLSI